MKIKKFFLFACTLLALTICAQTTYAEFFSDIIVTSPDALWTDSRAYSTLQDAIDSVGSDERTIVVAKTEVCTNLTIPSNVHLKFLRGGSIANSGQLTINTTDIDAGNYQIFTGSGDIDFASGSVIKSSWFSSLQSALSLTSDDTLTLIIDKAATITTNSSVGSGVTLKWPSPNIITVNAGFTLSNIKDVIAGDYQIFAGSGDFDFASGATLNSAWFEHLKTAIDYIGTDSVNLVVSTTESLDADRTVNANTNLTISNGGLIVPDSGVTLTINGPFSAGLYRVFSGDGSVVGLKEVYPEWWGVDGTADEVQIQKAIDSLSNGTLVCEGRYNINATIIGASDIIYDLRNASFYPRSGVSGGYIFHMSGKSNFSFVGGKFSGDALSPITTVDGIDYYYVDGAIHISNNCSSFKVYNSKFYNIYAGITVYDSSNGELYNNSFDSVLVGIAVVAENNNVANVNVSKNTIIDSGDDSIAFVSRYNAFELSDSGIIDNYIDRTATSGGVTGVGIRIIGKSGAGGTGEIRNILCKGNRLINPGIYGISVYSLFNSTISENIIYSYANVAGAAMRIATSGHECSYLTITNNILTNPQTANNSIGILSVELNNSIVSNNILECSTPSGYGSIDISNSDGNVISDNMLIDTGIGESGVYENARSGQCYLNKIFDNVEVINGVASARSDYYYRLQNNIGSVHNGPFYWLDGINDYISLGASTELDVGTHDASLVFVFRNIGNDGVSNDLFDVYDATTKDRTTVYINSSGHIILSIVENSISKMVEAGNIDIGADGKVHYLIAEIDRDSATGLKLFLDGNEVTYLKQEDPSSLSGNIASTGTKYLGVAWNGSGSPFSGDLSKFLFFNKILTSQEKLSLFNNECLPYKYIGASTASLTSGSLTVGKEYIIDNYNSGDDFTNVGAVSNASGIVFVATGTTPTNWSNGSSLRHIGCTVQLENDGISVSTWTDKSGNNVDGTVSGAIASNL